MSLNKKTLFIKKFFLRKEVKGVPRKLGRPPEVPGGPFRGRMFRGAQRRRAWAGRGPDPPRTRVFGLGCRVQVPRVSFPGERGAGRMEEAAGTGDGVPRWGCKSQAGRHGGLFVPRVAGTWRRLCPSFAARGGRFPVPIRSRPAHSSGVARPPPLSSQGRGGRRGAGIPSFAHTSPEALCVGVSVEGQHTVRRPLISVTCRRRPTPVALWGTH